MMIRVAKKGQASRTCTLEEINRLLASGELDLSDSAWHEGLPKWMPLHSIRGVNADVKRPAVPASSGGMSSSTAAGGMSGSLGGVKPSGGKTTVGGKTTIWGPARNLSTMHTLWDPNVAALWSLLFGCSPLFGAFITAKNWKEIGETGRATQNWFWFWTALALHATGFLLLIAQVTVELFIVALLNVACLVLWYFFFCRAQQTHIRREMRRQYHRRSWAPPVVAGFVCLIGYFALCIAISWFQGHFSQGPASAPTAVAQPAQQEQPVKRE